MNAIEGKKIAIIGGGPGGLTLARILQMRGADLKVYERDLNKDVRVQGATLDLHQESGLRALKEAGLMDAFTANFRPGAEKIRIIDKNANIVKDEHLLEKQEIHRPEIDRGPLRKILFDSLKPDSVVWNSQFISLSEEGESLRLHFQNGKTAEVDLVIAADGANSKIRPYITPIRPFYSGVTVVEGAVYDSERTSPKMHQLLKGGKIFAFGDSKTLIVASKGDGSLAFYTGMKIGESWVKESGIDFSDKDQVVAWFKKDFATWGDGWLEVFENSNSFYPRPQYCMPFDQTWEAMPNMTMLGDAAHLMPPFAGEGVNMAMLDALELGLNLSSDRFKDLRSAISVYEIEMRKRASETAKISMESQEAMHAPDAIQFLIDTIG